MKDYLWLTLGTSLMMLAHQGSFQVRISPEGCAQTQEVYIAMYGVKQRPSNQENNQPFAQMSEHFKPSGSRNPAPSALKPLQAPQWCPGKEGQWVLFNLGIPALPFLYNPLGGAVSSRGWQSPGTCPSHLPNPLLLPLQRSSALWGWLQENIFKYVPESESVFVRRSV